MKPKYRILVIILSVAIITFYFILPGKLFAPQYSTILEDQNGILLGARIAKDGQWRFPPAAGADTISQRYVQAVVQYEDKRFFSHFGVNIRAIARAIKQNIKNKRFVSGASTISMQTISLYRGHKAYNIVDKCWEIILAIRLEMSYSKEEILQMYAAHAPFGGNTVGYGASTWRYFGKHNKTLTWPEAALLAILPNDPALIHLSKNRNLLLQKRNHLLQALSNSNIIAATDLPLYMEEPLPDQPYPMPDLAPHLLASMKQMTGANYMRSTCDIQLQNKLNDLLALNSTALRSNQVNNAAILVADINTGNTLAYVGNIKGTGRDHGEQVDIIQANRSTGSLLKPFLSMMALQEGRVTTKTLLTDIPVNIDGFKPDNFTYDYEGSIPLDEALRKSLNIPFVLLLKEYNISRCLQGFRSIGLNKLNQSAEHYGLSLIIGGGESTLWELCGAYASCARILNHFSENSGRYSLNDIHPLSMNQRDKIINNNDKSPGVMDAGAIWQVFDILSENPRPGRFEQWKEVSQSSKIAWKTGTSIGFRDAWAIGITSKYVVGIWIGNADGEGRPGVIGLETAAPLLFEVFGVLPRSRWFNTPFDALKKTNICTKSGFSPNEACSADTILTCSQVQQLPVCPYDQYFKLDKQGAYRVNSTCYDPYQMTQKAYFVLPASQQFYYSKKHPLYKQPPPYLSKCSENGLNAHKSMQFIYPNNVKKLFLPKDINGKLNPVTFEVALSVPNSIVYWHLDDDYLGSTIDDHQYTLIIPEGRHTLRCIDKNGNFISTSFEAIHSNGKN